MFFDNEKEKLAFEKGVAIVLKAINQESLDLRQKEGLLNDGERWTKEELNKISRFVIAITLAISEVYTPELHEVFKKGFAEIKKS